MQNTLKNRDNLTIVANFPAWVVYDRAPDENGFTEIFTDEPLALDGGKYPFSQRFYAYSLEDYYAKDGRELTEERRADSERRHRENGMAGLYDRWINPISACLTSHKRPQEECIAIHIGMHVKYMGEYFTIEKAPNSNLKFVRVEHA